MKKIKKLLSFLVIAVLSFGASFSLLGCNNVSNEDENSSTYVKLTSSEYVVNTNDNSVSKTITATVYPSNAPNKTIDWFVEWDVNNEGEDAVISDYITVTPIEEGSNVATVTVFRDFQGSTFTICATTRVGGFSAFCKVSYIGVPSSLEIVQNDGTMVYDNNWEAEINNLKMGQTYYFDLNLDNVFNNVTSDYKPNIKFSAESFGKVVLNIKRYTNTTDDPTWVLQSQGNETVDFKFYTGSNSLTMNAFGNTSIFTISYEDGKIKVLAGANPYNGTASQRGSKAEWSFVDYTNGILPYFKLTVTDENTGLSQTINIRTIPTVEGVDLDSSELLI